ncbi:hypothetical protein FACS1894214_0570 [Planctomycetales bacterium]|nr:hypothetical protein FACS1894214_0570 [Planctomycetales bacterium]
MFNQFLIIFLVILLPLTEGFLLAWYFRYIEPPPEPETEKEYSFAEKVPNVDEPLDELPEGQVAQEQGSSQENTEETTAENTDGIEPAQSANQSVPEQTSAELQEIEVPVSEKSETLSEDVQNEVKAADNSPAMNSPFDNAEAVLQSLQENGIAVNETLNQMLSDSPVEIASDLEKRIEENTEQQKKSNELSENEESSNDEHGGVFDLPDEDELLQRMTENAGRETAAVPDFLENNTETAADAQTEEITKEDIAPAAVEVLGKDFDFESLKNSIPETKSKPAEE